jgi:hypothetical protein
MKGLWLTSAALLTSLGGCAPLSQASLVYTSAATLGVGVRAPSPEGSGVSLTVGYGQIDAAYVPVMVARPCPTNTPDTCTQATHPLQPIIGHNNVDRSDKALDDSLNQARLAVETASQAVRRLEQAIDLTNQRQDERGRRLREAQEQNARANESVADGAPAPQRIDTTALEAEIARDRDGLPQLRADLETARTAERDAIAHYRGLVERVRSNNIDVKDDAFSVFGSFNGSAGGNAPNTQGAGASGNLTVGRAFSTGVASQHLTQGIRESALAQGMAACLAEARRNVALAPTADQPALMSQLSAGCAVASRSSN